MTTHTDMVGIAELYALDTLNGHERADFESHLSYCEVCQARVADSRALLASLVPDGKAPEHVWARIVAELETDSPVATMPDRRISIQAVVAIAAVIAIALGGVLWSQRPPTTDEALIAAANRAIEEPGSSLSEFVTDGVTIATVVLTVNGAGYILPTDGLRPLDESLTYQLWVINDQGSTISGGVLGNDPAVSTFTWTDDLTGLVLTREKAGGVETSEGDVVSMIAGI